MAAHKLILRPADPAHPAVDVIRLAGRLQAIGLIGMPRKINNDTFYPTGDHFLQLVTFLGCSPQIELEPPSDPSMLAADSAAGKFCHVFLSSTRQLRFRSDPHTRAPQCPACHAPIADWAARIREWQTNPDMATWDCAQCGATGQLTGLAFGKVAAFGRTFVEIRGIYPSEAVPGETLLDCLESITGGKWSTLYIKE